MKADQGSKTAHLSKSNLIQLLKTLSKEEMKAFDKFVRSPFHNNRNEVTRYFLLLKKHYPSFSQQELIAGKIYKKIYPGKVYKDNIMRRLSSNLFRLAEDYLAISKFNKHKYPFSLSLLDSLTEHGLDDLFMKTYTNIISDLKEKKIDNKTLDLRLAYENIYITHNIIMGRQRKMVANEVESGTYKILNFFAELPLSIENLKIIKYDYDYEPKQNLIEKFIINFNLEGFLKGIDFSQNEYLKVLPLYIYRLLLFHYNENEKYYHLYKTAIFKHRDILSDDGLNSHLSSLENYCVHKIKHGRDNKYRNEAYKVARLKVEENLLIVRGYINLVSFLNVVSTGCGAKKLDFVEKFIRENGNKLMPEFRENVLHFCRAKVHFERRNFEKALEEVNKIKYLQPHIELHVKTLLSKIYYEMDYAEQLFSHIDSFRHYILNKKTNYKNIQEIRSYLSYLQKLNTLKTEPDSEKLYAVTQSLNDPDIEMDRGHKDWLLEKVEELEAKIDSKNQRTYRRSLIPSKIPVN